MADKKPKELLYTFEKGDQVLWHDPADPDRKIQPAMVSGIRTSNRPYRPNTVMELRTEDGRTVQARPRDLQRPPPAPSSVAPDAEATYIVLAVTDDWWAVPCRGGAATVKEIQEFVDSGAVPLAAIEISPTLAATLRAVGPGVSKDLQDLLTQVAYAVRHYEGEMWQQRTQLWSQSHYAGDTLPDVAGVNYDD